VDHESPLLEAIIPYRDNEFYQQMLHALAREFHIDLKKPFKDLPEDVKEGILRKGLDVLNCPSIWKMAGKYMCSSDPCYQKSSGA